MTKTQLQIAVAETTQTNKKKAALFLDTLSVVKFRVAKPAKDAILGAKK
jgi:hypothetical protein